MSEFSNHRQKRLEDLKVIFEAVTYKQNQLEVINQHKTSIDNATPGDVVILVHRLVESGMNMTDLKSGISKILNVLHKTLDNFSDITPPSNTFFDVCLKNNLGAIEKLSDIRPLVVQINKSNNDEQTKIKIKAAWKAVEKFTSYYTIKENVLFPLAEKYLPDYKCIGVMWSIHDDTRRNIKEMINMLSSDSFDLKRFNKVTGDTFYNIYTMKYREEKLLYPFMLKNIPNDEIEKLWNESVKIGFPYFNPEQKTEQKQEIYPTSEALNLGSGLLRLEQIVLIFNHLPVDITFVDELNKVRFFSTPQKRIFTRTNAIIGRDVRNCHPHESVHVVEKIIDSFRRGEKEHADFWINMKGHKVLIQYFAVRNEQKEYKGVIEVTQEISEIQAKNGEKRILDWEG
ncbi:MAG: PAS domain-containing protein [Paludibacteraceae bacterium]